MSWPFVDISTQTVGLGGNNVTLGDYNIPETETQVFNKSAGVGTALYRGHACTPNNAVTPNTFIETTGKVGGMVVIPALPQTRLMSYINPTGNGENICAGDGEISFNAIIEGTVVVRASGAGQPGDFVMTAAGGKFQKYDNSGPQYIKGVYLGHPGGVTDAAIIKTGFVDGDLIVIKFNGGAS